MLYRLNFQKQNRAGVAGRGIFAEPLQFCINIITRELADEQEIDGRALEEPGPARRCVVGVQKGTNTPLSLPPLR